MNARTERKETGEDGGAEETRDRVLETVEEEKRGTRVKDGTEGREGCAQKKKREKEKGGIERNASKLEIVDGGGNRVKQRERNSRGGGGGRVAVLRKKFSEATERSSFGLSRKGACLRCKKKEGERESSRAKRVLQICRRWHGRARERARE